MKFWKTSEPLDLPGKSEFFFLQIFCLFFSVCIAIMIQTFFVFGSLIGCIYRIFLLQVK